MFKIREFGSSTQNESVALPLGSSRLNQAVVRRINERYYVGFIAD